MPPRVECLDGPCKGQLVWFDKHHSFDKVLRDSEGVAHMYRVSLDGARYSHTPKGVGK